MTARFSYANMDPQKVPVKLYEGYVTVADKIGPDGMVIEDTVAYSAPLVKGDKVKVYSDSTSGGEIVMQKYAEGSDVDIAYGVVIDTPMGADNTTATTYTPTHALRRSATVRFFGTQIEEHENTSGTYITAGYNVVWDESDDGVVVGALTGNTLVNGSAVALAYTAAAGFVPVLRGFNGHGAED